MTRLSSNMLAAWNSLETTRFRVTDLENSMHFGETDFPRLLAERSADRWNFKYNFYPGRWSTIRKGMARISNRKDRLWLFGWLRGEKNERKMQTQLVGYRFQRNRISFGVSKVLVAGDKFILKRRNLNREGLYANPCHEPIVPTMSRRWLFYSRRPFRKSHLWKSAGLGSLLSSVTISNGDCYIFDDTRSKDLRWLRIAPQLVFAGKMANLWPKDILFCDFVSSGFQEYKHRVEILAK